MSAGSAKLLKDLGIQNRRPPDLYRRRDQLFKRSARQANAVSRAWDAMGLDGVLYVDKSPTVYLKEVGALSDEMERRLQRHLWNQAVAPILILSTPSEVLVYSGQASPAGDDDAPREDNRLVSILDRTADALELQQLVPAIETGHIYAEHSVCFDRECAVDRDLLRNLTTLRSLLGDLKEETIDALLTRIIFVCYLIEREIIEGRHFQDPRLAEVKPERGLRGLLTPYRQGEALDVLYTLFEELRDKGSFNGNMFDDRLDDEKERVEPRHMAHIQRFLQGDNLRTGQKSLGFWAYDFRIIPVETISAIYQEFIAAQGEKSQRKIGAYYTAPHLAELVVDTAIDGWDTTLDKKVLDPACGSGIFLVTMFHRMAQEWQRGNTNRRNPTRADALTRILQENLYGIDTNETACRITCFSLYLALLDHLEPRDIVHLQGQGRVLPPLLRSATEPSSPEDPRPIVCGNFFDPDLPIEPEHFDLVIGNPPWVSRGNCTDTAFLQWRETDPDVRAPQKQMAHGFMWRAPRYLRPDGRACLLVPSAVLLDKTDKFQEKWFSSFRVEEVLNLSDLRHLVFSGAKHPGIVVRFRNTPPDGEPAVEYSVPKVEQRSLRGGPVYIAPDDRRSILQSRILDAASCGEAPLLWKKYLWATPRDVQLLDRLSAMPRLRDITGKPGEGERWVKGQGFQPLGPSDLDAKTGKPVKEPKKPFWKPTDLFADATIDLSLVALRGDCTEIGKADSDFSVLRRCPDPALFSPPIVLVSQGFSKQAFCDFPVLFRDSLQSIGGPREDADLLAFLAAVLGSPVAMYFLFHTAANWGTERSKVHLNELGRLPFPLPERATDPKKARKAIDRVVRRIERLRRDIGQTQSGFLHTPERRTKLVARAKKDMEPAIYAYYGIDEWEQKLIEDTVSIFEPSSTPTSPRSKVPTLQPPAQGEREAYVSFLCAALNSWGARSGQKVNGEVVYAPQAGAAIVTIEVGRRLRKYAEKLAPERLSSLVARISGLLPRRTRSLIDLRDLKVFDGDRLHILKPLTMRYWTQTAALNDADEIAAAILIKNKAKSA